MKAFMALLGLSFKSLLLTSLNFSRRGKKAVPSVLALLLLAAIVVVMSVSYSFPMAALFGPMGGLDLVVMIMVGMALVFSIILVIYGAQSMIFSTKDVDLVLSLPVSAFTIMLSRVLALFLESLFLCEAMLIPAGIACLVHGQPGGAGFMLLLMLVGFFAALAATLVALLFGSFVALVVSRLPFKNLFTVLLSLLLMGLIMFFSFSFGTTTSSMQAADFSVNDMRQSIVGAVPPLGWAASAAFGNPLSLLLIAAVTVIPFLLANWVFSLFYKNILTRLSSHRLRNDYKIRKLSATGSFPALLKKEFGRFFSTPALVLNGGVGILLLVIASIAALFYKGTIRDTLLAISLSSASPVEAMLPPLLLFIMATSTAMTFVSCSSISLEGKTLWLLKTAPLSTVTIFTAKIMVNFMLGFAASVVVIPLLGYVFRLSVLEMVLIFINTSLFNLLTSSVGLLVNLWFPKMDADNDTVVIKQSASIIVTMLLNTVLMLLFIGLFLLTKGMGFLIFSAMAAAVALLLLTLVMLLLNTSGRKAFTAL